MCFVSFSVSITSRDSLVILVISSRAIPHKTKEMKKRGKVVNQLVFVVCHFCWYYGKYKFQIALIHWPKKNKSESKGGKVLNLASRRIRIDPTPTPHSIRRTNTFSVLNRNEGIHKPYCFCFRLFGQHYFI